MISSLRIENFAIIPRLELDLQPGLTVFTGETGAGKSIILDALTAVLGGKVDTTVIRAGAEKATVEAVVKPDADSLPAIRALLESEDLLEETDEILLAREIRSNGRSVARINGTSVNQSLLRELGGLLVDIHGQSEHLSLLNVRQHIHLLDRFAGVSDLLGEYQSNYRRYRKAEKELAELQSMEKEADARLDLLRYQLQEIEAAKLQPDEEDELRAERTRLANAEGLSSLAQHAVSVLDEGGAETPSASDLLGEASQALSSLTRIDTEQSDLNERLAAALDSVADIAAELRAYAEGIEFNPQRLIEVEDRLDLIQRLKRKYGGSLESVEAHAEKSRLALENITHAGERISELEAEIAGLTGQLDGLAAKLSAHRVQAAAELSRQVERELGDLSMAGAHFEADLQLRESFDEYGKDTIEFLVAPNRGEGLKPLVKVASGGETSRLMLALKRVLTLADAVPTLVFDEIDQGIGGQVGTVVGQKLWQLGRSHQVFCVTHLPQLAVYGDQHLGVRKVETDERTATEVDALDGAQRLEELASMRGVVTETSRKAAAEMLESARTWCSSKK